MVELTLKQKMIKADNRLTFIVGYRNLYNFVVLFIAAMSLYFAETLVSSDLYVVSLLLGILGFKWTLAQIYNNIDSAEVVDELVKQG